MRFGKWAAHFTASVFFLSSVWGAAQATDDAFIKSIAALPPEEQVRQVIVKLKVLNPQFDCAEQHKIEGGAVTELSFSTVSVTDISPVKALAWLRKLSVAPTKPNQKGTLADLSPLSGMQLTWLWCHNNPVTDLTPLHGLPLSVLSISGTRVADLATLSGMKLQVLSLSDTVVSDLTPLAGMPLSVLWCNSTQVKDFLPLKTLPLQELKCDFVASRDAAVLREIKTLAKINEMPAQYFWAQQGLAAPAPTEAPVTAAQRPLAARTAAPPSTSDHAAEHAVVLRTHAEKIMMTSTGMELVWIAPGEFMMGCTDKEREWARSSAGKEKDDVHTEPARTTIKQGFWLGRTEVTVGQWQKFAEATGYATTAESTGVGTGPNASRKWGNWKGVSWRNPGFGFQLKPNHPACCISHNDAVIFCKWLTETEQKAGRLPEGLVYRLPTEAEWEYACRGGVEGTKFWWGDSMEKGKGRLNNNSTSAWSSEYKFISPVDAFGSRGRNGFGLADMLGNVAEWCLDGYDPETAHEEPYKDNKKGYAYRGGSFSATNTPGSLRCAARAGSWPARTMVTFGFRVCGGVPR